MPDFKHPPKSEKSSEPGIIEAPANIDDFVKQCEKSYYSTPECQVEPVFIPTTEMEPSPQYIWGSHTVYIGHTDLSKADWFHVITNGAGLIGDIATFLAFIGIAPAAPVALAGNVIDVIGITADIYDVIVFGDMTGITWDSILYVADETKIGRVVPIIGFGLNLDGFFDALNEGYVEVPMQIPNLPTILTTP